MPSTHCSTPESRIAPEPAERFRTRGMASRQFARNAAAVAALVTLVTLVALVSLASIAAPYDPVAISLTDKLQSPGTAHWLGTDYFGRDVLSRVIWGGRVSLVVGILVVAIAMAVGVPVALIAGFAGGRVDNVLMRVMDAFLTFPPLLLAVAIVGSLGADIRNVMLALGLVNIPVFARLVRGSTLAVREELYVAAARALGATAPRIVVAHVLPNVVAPIVVQM